MPIFMVVMELGHEPHAPLSFSRTTSPSISTSSTLPPSAIKYGRTCAHSPSVAPLSLSTSRTGNSKHTNPLLRIPSQKDPPTPPRGRFSL